MSYIILGLGNPGEEYVESRHNAGRMVLQAVAKTHELPEWKADMKTTALKTVGKVGKAKAEFYLPETFMNKSGITAGKLVKSKKQAEQFVVVHDDLSLPLGSIRISFNKSAGGHRGVESVVKTVKTEAFIRVRMGVCPTTASGKLKRPDGDISDFIVGNFKKAELDVFKKAIKKAVVGIELILNDSREAAMTECNQS